MGPASSLVRLGGKVGGKEAVTPGHTRSLRDFDEPEWGSLVPEGPERGTRDTCVYCVQIRLPRHAYIPRRDQTNARGFVQPRTAIRLVRAQNVRNTGPSTEAFLLTETWAGARLRNPGIRG